MATRNERLIERNAKVRDEFYKVKAKNAKWRIDAVIEEVAKKFFLASRTVDAIISYEGTYNDSRKITQQNNQLSLL